MSHSEKSINFDLDRLVLLSALLSSGVYTCGTTALTARLSPAGLQNYSWRECSLPTHPGSDIQGMQGRRQLSTQSMTQNGRHPVGSRTVPVPSPSNGCCIIVLACTRVGEERNGSRPGPGRQPCPTPWRITRMRAALSHRRSARPHRAGESAPQMCQVST